MGTIFPGGTGVTRISPPKLSGGAAGPSVTPISATLTPGNAGSIVIPSSGSPISGGMFDGWVLFDPQGCVQSMSDGATTFDIAFEKATNNYAWLSNVYAPSAQPIICWPNEVMKDFEFEVKSTWLVDGSGEVNNASTSAALIVHERPTDPAWGNYFGMASLGRWASTCDSGFGVSSGGASKKNTSYANIPRSGDVWLKLDRVKNQVTGYHKIGAAASYTVQEGPDAIGGGGGVASYIGIALYTQSAAGSPETIKISNANLTGSEWSE